MTNIRKAIRERNVLSPKELESMFEQTKQVKIEYYRLRDAAVIALLRVTGKRAGEITQLGQGDIVLNDAVIEMRFHLLKKWMSVPKVDGTRVRVRNPNNIVLKRLGKDHPLAAYILAYIDWLQENLPKSQYIFPRTFFVPVSNYLEFDNKHHLTTRQLLRIVKRYNPDAWCHLFRDTVAADIVRSDNSIMAPFKVMQRLDHSGPQTAFNYMRRYAGEVIGNEMLG